MIATEQQLTVTMDRLLKFRGNIEILERRAAKDPIASLQLKSALAIVADLEAEISEYQALVAGAVREFAVETVEDLPSVLVRARIARKLSQSDLAELLGVKPQQVQRWESQLYENAAFSRLAQIAGILRVRLGERIELVGDEAPVPLSKLKRLLARLGVPQEVVERRILPRNVTSLFDAVSFDEVDARLDALFGWNAHALVSGAADIPVSQLRFKLPASAGQDRTRGYSAYVTGLCRIVASTMPPAGKFPTSWRATREAVFGGGEIGLNSVLDACWDRNIAVLPLRDPVAFHGAHWSENGKTVIVLKQTSDEESRWLQDLLHEIFHNAYAPPDEGLAAITLDETSVERRESEEERRAHRFGAEVVTDGRYAELTGRIVELAGNFGPALKSATITVADEAGIPVGILANLLAWRLGENGTSWWPVAVGLQGERNRGLEISRKVFAARFSFENLSRLQRSLLTQALEVE